MMVLVHPKMDEVCRLHPALTVAAGEKHVISWEGLDAPQKSLLRMVQRPDPSMRTMY